ncbi:hypothetical protein B0E53_02847 [Micromonospora sp. MH33]|uniref:hypothetical protein n=1 Tax=Micromonospora sp. MH33 TaxID=1945509 RepID=UPI000D149CC9|nr:hypothetical protein [Micromonospora sp. MH33]PSK65217.1 hypothetical protein B0E53_02847 [Micromonospora sp. MH33]
MVMPEGTNGNEHVGSGDERRTVRQRLSHHYHHKLDGGGRGAVVGAVIGLFGVLLTAVVTAVVTLHDAGDRRDGSPATPGGGVGSPTEALPAPTPSSPSAGSSVGTSTPSATSTVPPADQVRWSGPVRFDDDGIDLDATPPTVQMDWPVFNSDLTRTSAAGDGPLVAQQGYLARWPGPGTPTRQQCADLISSQGDERVHIPVGRIGCLSTSKDHIVMLTVTRFKDDTFQVSAHVTVRASPDETES